jgi:hypothetical protein
MSYDLKELALLSSRLCKVRIEKGIRTILDKIPCSRGLLRSSLVFLNKAHETSKEKNLVLFGLLLKILSPSQKQLTIPISF